MRFNRLIAVAVAALTVACAGSDSVTGPTYQSIAGTYTGNFAGISKGVALEATFTLTLTQSSRTLGGSYSTGGLLSDGVSKAPLLATGTIEGSIAPGNTPFVNITLTNVRFGNIRSNFSGAYDSVNQVITLNGTLQVYSDADSFYYEGLLSYPGKIILRR